MELASELLAKLLERQPLSITFPELHLSGAALLESASYQALCQIQAVLRDDSLDDPQCFQKIEEIVLIFEQLGSNCGSRHDF